MGIIIVGGVIEKDGKFLLVQEAKESCRGKWNIPAGRLENNENILDGAKREIYEECGCRVEPNGILQIANGIIGEDSLVTFIFSVKLLKENISFNTDEILDVGWFTYDEIIDMRSKLRRPEWIINAIKTYVDGKVNNLDLIQLI